MSDNITLPRELAEEVLEALIEARALLYDGRKQDKEATALRTALAAEQPKQEPSDDREAMKLALKALDTLVSPVGSIYAQARKALRTALAAPRLAVTVDPRLTPDEAAAISSALAAPRQKPEPVAKAWAEGYQQGVQDERTSEASIGIAGLGAKVEPARQNPYGTAPPAAAPEPTHPGYVIGSHWLETAYSRICAGEAEADVLRDCGWERVDEALRRDAERYRYLRDKAFVWDSEMPRRFQPVALWLHDVGNSGIDAAIDAAMGDKR